MMEAVLVVVVGLVVVTVVVCNLFVCLFVHACGLIF